MAEVSDTTSYQWPKWPWKKTDAVDDKATTDEDGGEAGETFIDVLGNDTNAKGVYKIFPVKETTTDVSLTDDALMDSVVAAEDYTASLSTKPYMITLESGATVKLQNGQVFYDPNGKFEHLDKGETASDSFGYAAYGSYNTDRARVDVTITGVTDDEPPTGNHPPVANDDTAYLPSYYPYPLPYEEAADSTTATTTDAPLSDDLIYTTLAIGEEGDPYPYPSEAYIDVLANDTDADGNPLHVDAIAGNKVDTDPTTEEIPDTVTLEQSGATVKLNADGSLTYTEKGYSGIDPVPLAEEDAMLTASSDGSGELVQIDPILPPYPGPVLVDSFTYTAMDATLSDEATVNVYRMSDWYVLDSADPMA